MARGEFVVFAWQRELAGLDKERPVNAEVTIADRHVALTLALFMDNHTGCAWPSLTTLASATGRKKRDMIVTSLHRLERLGYLDIVHGGIAGPGRMKRHNTYVCKSPYGGLKGGDASPRSGGPKSPIEVAQVPRGGLELLSSSQENFTPWGSLLAQKINCPTPGCEGQVDGRGPDQDGFCLGRCDHCQHEWSWKVAKAA